MANFVRAITPKHTIKLASYLRTFVDKDCPYCGGVMSDGPRGSSPTRDHVVPRSAGGRAILICCWTCNHRKGDMMPDDFLDTLAGCRRTIALIHMVRALQEMVLMSPMAKVVDLSATERLQRGRVARYVEPAPFSTTSLADAFARAAQPAGD